MFLDTSNQETKRKLPRSINGLGHMLSGNKKKTIKDYKCSWTHVIRKQKENYQGL